MFCLFLACADPAIGRIEKSMLSPQTLVELLTDGITNREKISGNTDNIKPIAEWYGEDIFGGVLLDQNRDVTSISFTNESLTGSLKLEWMPETTASCDFKSNKLSGTLDLEHLPDVLSYLDLGRNVFDGAVSLTNLPEVMRILRLNFNRLCGPIDLTSLPKRMEQINLGKNQFSGVTDFSNLPESLERLDVSRTQIKGEVWVKRKSQLQVFGVSTCIIEE